jgi:glycosyltransferase involved in cell wall biosynthesis
MSAWNLLEFEPVEAPARERDVDTWGDVAVDVYVAMRDEARNARGFLDSVLAVAGVERVVVADDASTDATASIVAQVALHDARVRLVEVPAAARPVPSPKARALSYAIEFAPPVAPLLFFTDADLRFSPHALRAGERFRRARNAQMVSFWPRVHSPSLWSECFAPLVTLVLLQWLPMRGLRGSDPRFAAATGQAMLVETRRYMSGGGHASIASPVEDVALARALKRAGARLALGSGATIATVRGYGGLEANARGYGRSLYFGAGSTGALVAAAWLCAAFVAPCYFAARGSAAGYVGVAASLFSRTVLACIMRESPRSIALAPLGGALGAYAAIRAILDGTGGRIAWRGRRLR